MDKGINKTEQAKVTEKREYEHRLTDSEGASQQI